VCSVSESCVMGTCQTGNVGAGTAGGGSATCLPTSTPGQSRCATPPDVGQPCVSTCRTFRSCVNGTCVAAGRVGQPCVDQFPSPCIAGECILGDGGVRVGTGSGGTCQAPRPNGAACSFDPGCQSGFCDRGGSLFSSTPGICVDACN
jgi:hypothetical protein